MQRLEALQGNATASRDELQQSRSLLLVELVDRAPEPLDDVRVVVAVLQPSVGLPIAHVDLAQTTDDQLQAQITNT